MTTPQKANATHYGHLWWNRRTTKSGFLWKLRFADWSNLNELLSNHFSPSDFNEFSPKVINFLVFSEIMAQNVNPFLEQQTGVVKQSEDTKKCPTDSQAVTKRYFFVLTPIFLLSATGDMFVLIPDCIRSLWV